MHDGQGLKLFGRSILAIIIGAFAVALIDSLFHSFRLFELKLLLSAVVYSPANLVFVWILYLTNVTRKPLTKTIPLVLECLGYYFILSFVRYVVTSLTKESLAHYNGWYTQEEAIIVYTFMLYFAFILLLKFLIRKFY